MGHCRYIHTDSMNKQIYNWPSEKLDYQEHILALRKEWRWVAFCSAVRIFKDKYVKVNVSRTCKAPAGTIGKVFWMDQKCDNESDRNDPGYTVIGFRDKDGKVWFTSNWNLSIIDVKEE